jgi:endo-1,4-beta-xylanase
MRLRNKGVWVLLAAAILLTCAEKEHGLKDAFKNDFLIGVALKTAPSDDQDARIFSIAVEQFNSITPENLLKWETVQPEPGRFDFGPADRFVKFGKKHDMFIVGHVLVCPNRTPGWVFKDEKGNWTNRATLLARMRKHIYTVVGRYRGLIRGWDVVNEFVDGDGRPRETPWLKIIGPDYAEKAFEYAHEADPKAELYYNDFMLYKPAKRAGVVKMAERILKKGLRLDAIGMQAHYRIDSPAVEDLDSSITAFSKLGLKVHFTELDMDVLPAAGDDIGADITQNLELQKKLDPYANGIPDSVQQALAHRYADLFRLFLKHRGKVGRVTLWGVSDGVSWLNDRPVRGRTNYPLLYDRDLKPKPAYYSIIKEANQASRLED